MASIQNIAKVAVAQVSKAEQVYEHSVVARITDVDGVSYPAIYDHNRVLDAYREFSRANVFLCCTLKLLEKDSKKRQFYENLYYHSIEMMHRCEEILKWKNENNLN